MKQICVINNPKMIKKYKFWYLREVYYKKFRIQFESCFFENFPIFYCFLITLRLFIFQIEIPLLANVIYSQMMPND